MRKTTQGNLEDRQAEAEELQSAVTEVEDHLRNAESCETPEDFDVNIDEAEEVLKRLLTDMKAIRQ